MARSTDRATAMRQRILETADRLFYGQGIRAVGVDTIAAEIGISKRTLYNHFPSKDDLIVAYLSRRIRPRTLSDRPAVEQILDDFDRLERSFSSSVFRGCPFVNAVAELKEPGHAANRLAIAFKEERRVWFRGLLVRAGAANADVLATQLQLLIDGAIAAAVVRGDPKVAHAAREAARVLLVAAGVDVTSAEIATAPHPGPLPARPRVTAGQDERVEGPRSSGERGKRRATRGARGRSRRSSAPSER
jgi:AcrR family transcriptional regulator